MVARQPDRKVIFLPESTFMAIRGGEVRRSAGVRGALFAPSMLTSAISSSRPALYTCDRWNGLTMAVTVPQPRPDLNPHDPDLQKRAVRNSGGEHIRRSEACTVSEGGCTKKPTAPYR
jgi:hypothetical protein